MTSMPILVFAILILTPLTGNTQKTGTDSSKIVYQSDHLVITRLTESAYIHTSFLNSETFGRVPCNGMVIANKGEAIVFDTPAGDTSCTELIEWIQEKLNCKIKAVIPTHFHEDCLGGLEEFNKNNIPSYANKTTIQLAKAHQFNIPLNEFNDSLVLAVGGKKVYAKFFGEGHTKDNVVGYFPAENVLFGGCLVKTLGAGKGNLEDANQKDWSGTVEKVKKGCPAVKIVIPGHGNFGDAALLDYTIELFRTN